MKKIVKVFYVIERNIIKRIDGFSPRKYMKCYNRYLKKIGINLVGTPRYIHPSVIFDGKGYSKTYIGNNNIISNMNIGNDSNASAYPYVVADSYRYAVFISRIA